MKVSGLNAFMARIDAAEYGLCRTLNRGATFAIPRHVFRIASRLGDGIVWYLLIVLLPIMYGAAAALRPAIVMALTGVLGLTLYTVLKRVFVRERPFITHAAIDLKGAPLDRYSFPSGHTLLAALIAGSRVVLGLHYPSDVLAGAAIGAALAELGTSLA